MGKAISSADKEVLSEIVRLIQKQGLKGADGGWKDYLECHDKKLGSCLSDPAKRSKELLVAFLQTFTKEEQKAFNKMAKRCAERNAMMQFMKDSPDLETPEQRLVCLTMQHPQYTQRFSFPFFEEEWITIHLGDVSEAMKSRTMIAVDCEMVLCQDGSEALAKICAVDHNLEVKLDELVNPIKAVADYRTHITGISSKDLDGVTCSLADIKKSLKKLLSHGTILVGHALHNDLRALKVDHPRVIDTSHIFKFAGLPTHSPSLNTLSKVVLGVPVRKEGEPHNCLNDAQAAMKLVLAKLEHGYDDLIGIASNNILNVDLSKLFIHKIPTEVPTQELQKLFPGEYNTIIESDIRIRGGNYSTHAVFRSVEEANEAFIKIEGQQTKDSSGRPQKHVFMKLDSGKTTSFYIRRMTADVHFNDSGTSKRLAQDEYGDSRQQPGNGTLDTKRQKTCLDQCNHVKEIEKLREALHQREEEIFNLQKILYFEVTRNQNL
ncbi:small RNA degrading nuclease 1 [Canna indica]|uniref:Small RNA degrading nuclease 1 n=1 Tax=Canna indica TaxID=4628 RepID=A0AAQ3KPX8_9LILI|nr:small RNA degrading nuclease 1 [Canna indica]